MLLRRLSNWKPSEPLPAAVDRGTIAAAVAEIDKRLEPAGVKAATVLVNRLFSAVPKPPPSALPLWVEKLKGHPAPVVAYAVERLIETWRYPNPPLIGDALALIDSDAGYRALAADRRRLAQALSAPPGGPQKRVAPEKVAALLATFPASERPPPPKRLIAPNPDDVAAHERDVAAAAKLDLDGRQRFWEARATGLSTEAALTAAR